MRSYITLMYDGSSILRDDSVELHFYCTNRFNSTCVGGIVLTKKEIDSQENPEQLLNLMIHKLGNLKNLLMDLWEG